MNPSNQQLNLIQFPQKVKLEVQTSKRSSLKDGMEYNSNGPIEMVSRYEMNSYQPLEQQWA